jgi:hypothetical protein
VITVTIAKSGAWKACRKDSITMRILSYRKKRVQEAGGYIGGHCAKTRHSSILHVTACAARAEALQAMCRQAESHSRDNNCSDIG